MTRHLQLVICARADAAARQRHHLPFYDSRHDCAHSFNHLSTLHAAHWKTAYHYRHHHQQHPSSPSSQRASPPMPRANVASPHAWHSCGSSASGVFSACQPTRDGGRNYKRYDIASRRVNGVHVTLWRILLSCDRSTLYQDSSGWYRLTVNRTFPLPTNSAPHFLVSPSLPLQSGVDDDVGLPH